MLRKKAAFGVKVFFPVTQRRLLIFVCLCEHNYVLEVVLSHSNCCFLSRINSKLHSDVGGRNRASIAVSL